MTGTEAVWHERLRLDVAQPSAGIRFEDANSHQFAHLLRIGGPSESDARQPKLVETYLRGQDCVATFAPTPPGQVQPQIYWRGIENSSPNRFGLEVLLSMQTSLLDSNPALQVSSDLPAGEAFSWCQGSWREISSPGTAAASAEHSGLMLFRPQNGAWSYAEAVYPADFTGSEISVSHSGRITLSHSFFAERLEKGVIRRGRIAGWILPRDNDQPLALEAWQTFCESPPPLTA